MPGRSPGCNIDEVDSDWSEDDECDEACNALDVRQLFPDVLRAIDSAIAKLGGKVVPKLNWSCPTDATWLTTSNTLACESADEVRSSPSWPAWADHDLSMGHNMGGRGHQQLQGHQHCHRSDCGQH